MTLFGESAGGWSVSYHLASQKSKGYFDAAIIQSGPLDMGLIYTDKSKALPELHQEYVKNVGCSNKDGSAMVECLQKKSVTDLMDGFQLSDECNCRYQKIHSRLAYNSPIEIILWKLLRNIF